MKSAVIEGWTWTRVSRGYNNLALLPALNQECNFHQNGVATEPTIFFLRQQEWRLMNPYPKNDCTLYLGGLKNGICHALMAVLNISTTANKSVNPHTTLSLSIFTLPRMIPDVKLEITISEWQLSFFVPWKSLFLRHPSLPPFTCSFKLLWIWIFGLVLLFP